MFRALLIAAVLLGFTGCGFHPLHSRQPADAAATAALRQISVLPIPERLGQMLRIELTDRLTPDGAPRSPVYVLDVTVTESKQDLAVRKDATATRANLIMVAKFQLKRAASGEELFSGTMRSINSYNILDADFATLSAEADARRRAARDLAMEIESRLGIFFSR